MNKQTIDYIRAHARDDVRTLALRKMPEGVDASEALQQIEGRQLASRKLPTWVANEELLWPKRLSMEQCSSEEAAAYKADIIDRFKAEDDIFIDLTGGFGVDFATIARRFRHSIYVERDAALCKIAAHNFSLLGITDFNVVNDTAETVIERLPDTLRARIIILIDPARRDNAGRKTVLIEDCTPDVCALQERLRAVAKLVVVKLSPMLDITAAIRAIKGVSEVHTVSIGGECKEVLLVVGQEVAEPVIHCCGLRFTQSEEQNAMPEYADELGTWLYEPDAAILKAGMLKTIAIRFGVRKLSPMSHLYTSDKLIEDWPGKRFPVTAWTGFSKKELRTLLQGISCADLTVRGFPQTTATLRKQLRLREGGPVHLFAATLANGRHIMVKSQSV